MMTPFDWQEAMGQRAQYVAGRLSEAIPVLAVSSADGIVMATLSQILSQKHFGPRWRKMEGKHYNSDERSSHSFRGQQALVRAIIAFSVIWRSF